MRWCGWFSRWQSCVRSSATASECNLWVQLRSARSTFTQSVREWKLSVREEAVLGFDGRNASEPDDELLLVEVYGAIKVARGSLAVVHRWDKALGAPPLKQFRHENSNYDNECDCKHYDQNDRDHYDELLNHEQLVV